METRTVRQMVLEDYKKWFSNAMIGFGAFNLNRKSNRGATRGLCRIVNFIIAVIGTPWIIAHWVAFCNKNVRPRRTSNIIGYWIATIVSLLLDAAFIGASVFILWLVNTHPQGALLSFVYIVFFAIPLFWVGIKKIPYIFMKEPIHRKLYTENTKDFKPYWELDKPEPHIQYVKYNNGVYEILTPASTEDSADDEEEQEEEEEIVEEFPFCQIFRLGGDKDLHIMRVEYCPDETAFIRVVSNDSYTKPYKRKVQRDKRGERFILFNNERFYLDPNKTQPRMPE